MDAQFENDRKSGEQDGVQDPKCYPKLDDPEEEYKVGANASIEKSDEEDNV